MKINIQFCRFPSVSSPPNGTLIYWIIAQVSQMPTQAHLLLKRQMRQEWPALQMHWFSNNKIGLKYKNKHPPPHTHTTPIRHFPLTSLYLFFLAIVLTHLHEQSKHSRNLNNYLHAHDSEIWAKFFPESSRSGYINLNWIFLSYLKLKCFIFW